MAVVVDPSALGQTIREVGGGNFIHRFGGVRQALDPVGRLNLDTLDPAEVYSFSLQTNITADLLNTATVTGIEAAIQAYRQAVAERFRFFSYGDCMLIE